MQIKNLIKLLIEYQEHVSKLVACQFSPERVQKIKKDIAATTHLIQRQIEDIQRAKHKNEILNALKQKKRAGRNKTVHKQVMQNNDITSNVPSLDDFDDEENVTPLMAACKLGLPNMAQLLITAGASLNIATSDGKTALTFAIENGHDDVVNYLLAQGASFRCHPSQYRYHPLVVAARENGDSVLKVITRLMAQFPHEEDQFIYAHTIFALIKRPLLTHHENILRFYNDEAQYEELINHRVKVVIDLLEYFLPKAKRDFLLAMRPIKQIREFESADNQRCSLVGMYSALALAAENAHVAVVKRLLEFGFAPDEKLPGCIPPIVAATSNRNPEVAKCLVEAGADLSIHFQGEPLIYWAMLDSSAHAMLKYLIEQCGMLSRLNSAQQNRAFDSAIKADNYVGCELFLKHGFNPNQFYSKSKTIQLTSVTFTLTEHFLGLEPPLVAAIRKQNINIIDLIMRQTDKENSLAYADKETGDSVLMLAVKTRDAGIVRIVLQHHDDEVFFRRRNSTGMNALQLAATMGQVHIFYLLWSWLHGVRGENIPIPLRLLSINDNLDANLPAKLAMHLVMCGIEPTDIAALRECMCSSNANPQSNILLAITQILTSQLHPAIKSELNKYQHHARNELYGMLLAECKSYFQVDVGDKLLGLASAFDSIATMQQDIFTMPATLSCDLPERMVSLRAYVMLAHLQHFFIFDHLHDHLMKLHDQLDASIKNLNQTKLIALCQAILTLQRNACVTFKGDQTFDCMVKQMRESLLLRLEAYSKKFELLISKASMLIGSEKNKLIKAARKEVASGINPQPKAMPLEKTLPTLFINPASLIETTHQSAPVSKETPVVTKSKKQSDSRASGSNANKRSRQQEAERIKQEQARQLALIQQTAVQYQKAQAEQELHAKQMLEKEEARQRARELSLQVNTVVKHVSLNKKIRKKFNLLGSTVEQAYLVGSAAVNILQGSIKDSNADWDFVATDFDHTHFIENEHIPYLFTYQGKGGLAAMRDKIDVMLVPSSCLTESPYRVIDLAKECQRRDTTRKAVFINVEGCVYDPTGYGLADIESNIIRVIIHLDYATADPHDIQQAIEARWLEDPKRLARWLKEMTEGATPEVNLSAILQRIDLKKIADPKQQDELFFKIKKMTDGLSDDGMQRYNHVIAKFGLLEKLEWLRDQWKSRRAERSPQSHRLFGQPISQSTFEGASTHPTTVQAAIK
jgi:ankyrin repeat protein